MIHRQNTPKSYGRESASGGNAGNHSPDIQTTNRRAARQRGVALVIVLAALVLISVLVISFFSSVTTELSSAKQYASGESTRQLADSAVQLVMAQVANATAGFQVMSSGGSPDTTKPLAWASQPGMIRTYDNSGAPYQFYKLYSSDQMVLTESTTLNAAYMSNEIANWYNQPAMFTDMNQPVLAPDSAGSIVVTGSASANGTFSAHYPILDPMAQDPTSPVEGFSVGGASAGYTGANPPGANYNPASSIKANPAPMPVKWLYVLSDGSVVSPTAASGNTVTVPGATAANPITGRVAFWTDDETCKVNINTASEGTFWDTPRVNNQQDRESGTTPGLALSQPFQHEWQRYPGHPAMTALSTIFYPNDVLPLNYKEQLYNLVSPRVNGGGTKGGSLGNTPVNPAATLSTANTIAPDADRLYTSVDEFLFQPGNSSFTGATTQQRQTNPSKWAIMDQSTLQRLRFFLTANSRAPEVNLFNQPRIGIWPVDVDLAGNANSPYTTIFDRMIARCSTIGAIGNNTGKQYYFQRRSAGQANSQSNSADYQNIQRNRDLYAYLQGATGKAIPGFGGGTNGFLGKYGTDRDQILTEIFDYIRSTNQFDDNLPLTNPNSSGVGVSETLYQYTPKRYFNALNGNNSLDPGHSQVVPMQIPTASGTTSGFGRMTTISEAALAFACVVDPIAMRDMGTDPNDDTSPKNDIGGSYNQVSPYMDPVSSGSMVKYNNPIRYIVPADLGPAPTGDLNGDGVVDEKDIFYPLIDSTKNYRFVQAAFLLEAFSPSFGYHTMHANMHIYIKGLDSFTLNHKPMGFPHETVIASYTYKGRDYGSPTGQWPVSAFPYDTRSYGGVCGPAWVLASSNQTQVAGSGLAIYSDAMGLVSNKIMIPAPGATEQTNVTMPFTGGTVIIEIRSGNGLGTIPGGNGATPASIIAASGTATVLQHMEIKFPDGTFPAPMMVQTGTPKLTAIDNQSTSTMPRRYWWRWNKLISTGTVGTPLPGRLDVMKSDLPLSVGNSPSELPGIQYNEGFSKAYCATQPATFPVATYPPGSLQGSGVLFRGDVAGTAFVPKDVVRSMVPCGNDPRLIAGQYSFADTGGATDTFVPHGDYNSQSVMFAHTIMDPEGEHYGADFKDTLAGTANIPVGALDGSGTGYNIHIAPDVAVTMDPNAIARGDWDNGWGAERDGAYINKPDDGDFELKDTTSGGRQNCPYFWGSVRMIMGGPTYFSPNRKVPSAVMFGSLPSGIKAHIPFQTLLFRPDVGFTAGYHHPGAGTSASSVSIPPGSSANPSTDIGPSYTIPPDHLLLDLFTMPIVEPYAISEPFSTAGKINMNYSIVPFNYITRSTGVRAVLKNELVTAIPNGAASDYKWSRGPNGSITNNIGSNSSAAYTHNGPLRYPINLDETIKGFTERFSNNDIFRSASEICDIHLVPQTGGTTYSMMENGTFWPNYRLTGDNTRERSYADIYPRLTTKSNTFTVHVRVQTLRKVPGYAATQWVEGRDQVTGEYRGSSIIERYIDANDPKLPDFATNPTANIDAYYRFHVVSTKRFSP